MSDNQRHPDSTFAAEYPYNKAIITRSGHEIHINDTPGNESIRISHTRGTYFEIDKDGKLIQTANNKVYEYYKDGMTETVDGQKDVKIGGNLNVNIDNSVSTRVAKNNYVGISGDSIHGVGGNEFNHTTHNKFESIGANNVIDVAGDLNENIEGDSVTRVGGTKTEMLDGDWSTTTAGNIEILGNGTMRVRCSTFIIEAESIVFMNPNDGGSLTISADGTQFTTKQFNMKATQDITMNGANINLNNG